jgi:hypothetical protein
VEKLVPINFNTTVVGAQESSGGLVLELRNSKERRNLELHVDQVIAGSGYVIDVDRLAFLEPKLRAAIRRIGSAAKLDQNFEASVPGLHFVGPASALSFGPLFRFVVGADYTSRVVAARLASYPRYVA